VKKPLSGIGRKSKVWLTKWQSGDCPEASDLRAVLAAVNLTVLAACR
jgi:hypothetical protein